MIDDPRYIAKQDQLRAGLRRRLTADGVNLEDPVQCQAINITTARIAVSISAILADAGNAADSSRMALYALTTILDALNAITTIEARP